MTRSEAAKICQSIKFILENSDYTEAVEEAFNMAIEALEQQETLQNLTKPNKSDLISRQAAIDALHTRFKDGFDEDKWWNSTHVLAAIEGLPSAQPFTSEQIQTMQELEYAQIEKAYELGKADRPKGEWIKTEHCLTDNGYRKWIELECPFCDFRPVFELIDDMNFCPNCGADMRERNDG